jgi:hypothetical protein
LPRRRTIAEPWDRYDGRIARRSLMLGCLIGLTVASPLAAQIPGQNPLNQDPLRPRGQNVIPIYDGWFGNADGSRTLCFAYFNMNTEQSLDIPLGPENRIEPSQYDGLQPTHFDPVPDPTLTPKFRHHWCVFSVTVPDDFGTQDIVWTLASQGDELVVPGGTLPEYILDEPISSGRGASAPFLRLEEGGEELRGRTGLWSGPRTVRVNEPLTLTSWIRHAEAGTWLGWTQHQGPGQVTFSEAEFRLDTAEAAATTTVTFDQPGSYIVRVQAINDLESGRNPTYGFEFHCCWTNGYVRVEVVD